MQNFQKFIVAEARNHGLSPERSGRSRPRGTQHAKPKARYAVVPQRFEELDSAQTSSCEDARRPARKGVRIHKAVAVLHLAGVEKSDYFSKIIHKDR